MKTKLVTTLILIMVALSIVGFSYACSNGWQINCYCNCDVKFTLVTTSDNEFEKDVATVTATIIGCAKDKIEAYITNGYPCYEAYINYTIKNTGCKPVHFENLTIMNPNPEALEITTTNHTCTWLAPCNTVQGSTTVHILQPAQQNWQYKFEIKIGLTCQEGYPRTIGFWKNQFEKATCKNGNPQVPAATLEQYLNQISSQSPIYEFTGTRKEKFKQAIDILSITQASSMKAKLKAHLLALWLNYVAGWTEGYKYKGMTAWQIIQGSENALLNNQSNKYEYWKNMCDGFNNLGGW